MAAFNFPDPTVQQTVTNPITGSTYQWKEPPGKWVITTKVRAVTDIIYEGDSPPFPRGDYKLWYSTDSLELYFWYEDVNGNGAWVPTAAPITMLENLEADVQLALAKAGVAEAAANANLTTIGLLDQALADVENSLSKVTLEYVRKTGDNMTGKLETTAPIWIRPDNEGPSGANNMLIVNQSGADSGSIMRICQDGTDIIKVQYDKTTTFTGNRITNIGDPVENKDAVNKAYVDTTVASISGGTEGLFEASYWTLDKSMDRDEVTQGKFCFDGSDFYMARSNSNGHTWCPGDQGWRTTNAWVTIYSKTGDLMHTFEINRINFKEKYGKKYIVEFEDTWSYKTKDLVNGEEYVIIVPGFMT